MFIGHLDFLRTEEQLKFFADFFFFLVEVYLLTKLCDMVESTLEKAMAPHSSTVAWKIPWTEEPGRLQSMGSLRVGHD